MIPNKIL